MDPGDALVERIYARLIETGRLDAFARQVRARNGWKSLAVTKARIRQWGSQSCLHKFPLELLLLALEVLQEDLVSAECQLTVLRARERRPPLRRAVQHEGPARRERV